MRNHSITSLDQPLLDRMTFDHENDAWRVSLVSGASIEVKADASEIAAQIKEGLKDIKLELPETKSIEVPVIVKETVIERVEVPVIVKELEIREIEKFVYITKIEIQQIEKQVVITNTEYKTVEIPVVITKIEEKIIKSVPIWTVITMVVELGLILVLLIAKK